MNVLKVNNRKDFRIWLSENSQLAKECWVYVKRAKPIPSDNTCLWYLDAVEEALCFGWIDSVCKYTDGILLQRFSPRIRNSNWTELNKERVRRLEKLGLMTNFGRAVLPNMNTENFIMDADIVTALKNAKVFDEFKNFPPLYQRIRVYNVVFYKKRNHSLYMKALQHLIDETKKGKMFGNWNDYGRLPA